MFVGTTVIRRAMLTLTWFLRRRMAFNVREQLIADATCRADEAGTASLVMYIGMNTDCGRRVRASVSSMLRKLLALNVHFEVLLDPSDIVCEPLRQQSSLMSGEEVFWVFQGNAQEGLSFQRAEVELPITSFWRYYAVRERPFLVDFDWRRLLVPDRYRWRILDDHVTRTLLLPVFFVGHVEVLAR